MMEGSDESAVCGICDTSATGYVLNMTILIQNLIGSIMSFNFMAAVCKCSVKRAEHGITLGVCLSAELLVSLLRMDYFHISHQS